MGTNFRQMCRDAVSRAKIELCSEDSHRIQYGALEIRRAIEAITYDRALAFAKELSPEVYAKWQPRHLLAEIHRLDPQTSLSATISLSSSPERSVELGREVPFTVKNTKRFYDRLSSYLHIPTLSQLREGGHDLESLKKWCFEAIEVLDAALNSKVWNNTIGIFTEIDCSRCGGKVIRRLPGGDCILDAKCHQCGAAYHIEVKSGMDKWFPDRSSIVCGCGVKNYFWNSELRPGLRWTCCGCGESAGTVALVLQLDPSKPQSTKRRKPRLGPKPSA